MYFNSIKKKEKLQNNYLKTYVDETLNDFVIMYKLHDHQVLFSHQLLVLLNTQINQIKNQYIYSYHKLLNVPQRKIK